MIFNKWLISTRNKISSIAAEFDSAAAIEGAKLTRNERETLQKKLRAVVDYIDEARSESAKKGDAR